jgi:4'-phosphopantetheinyl transferase EntD
MATKRDRQHHAHAGLLWSHGVGHHDMARTWCRRRGSDAITPDVWRELFTIVEIAWLGALPALERNAFATVLFSAKEAYYKSQHSLTLSWLDFIDAEVTLGAGRFQMRRLKPMAPVPDKVEGRFLIGQGLVITATAIA